MLSEVIYPLKTYTALRLKTYLQQGANAYQLPSEACSVLSTQASIAFLIFLNLILRFQFDRS